MSNIYEQMLKALNLPTRVILSHNSGLRLYQDLALDPELSDALPLPNPQYLHIHAYVYKVAHMSGAAGYIDYIFRKMEDIDVLAEDGTSVDALKGTLLLFLA
ncbi:hypothetical protein BT96DRAFT_1023393 [Gymnopus androsaceus JB14]|uniref:Uncharacterized protein n=1 Tax=Gymnopus androsaceus JB14 TaxID=1447944 RepID=A0A6A4H5Y9_9AGAR|nr:hypothetical protein BT96DRAFT_1023393 [Gymnopus androsaceus JB14]